MTRHLSGIMTVELAYLMPILLLVFQMVLYGTFYYHDKGILLAAAGETAVVAASYERRKGAQTDFDAEAFFREQIRGKLVLFSEVEMDAAQTEREIEIVASAKNGRMGVKVVQRAAISKPETVIRRTRAAKELLPEEGEGQ